MAFEQFVGQACGFFMGACIWLVYWVYTLMQEVKRLRNPPRKHNTYATYYMGRNKPLSQSERDKWLDIHGQVHDLLESKLGCKGLTYVHEAKIKSDLN